MRLLHTPPSSPSRRSRSLETKGLFSTVYSYGEQRLSTRAPSSCTFKVRLIALFCVVLDIIGTETAGNAGNPLARLPIFECLILPSSSSSPALQDTAILAIAPRSYWKSTNATPTERGITSDYVHALTYACTRFPTSSIIMYGHSLGGAAAVCLAATQG